MQAAHRRLDARARSRGGHQVVISRRRRHRQCLRRARDRFRCSIASQPERALAASRAAAGRGASGRRFAWRSAPRSPRSADAVIERRETAERYRTAAVKSAGEIERIAQVSYDAGRARHPGAARRLSHGRVGTHSPGGARRGRACKPKSNSNSSAVGRFHDETSTVLLLLAIALARVAACASA